MNNNIKMSNTETEFIGGQNRKWMGRMKNKQHFFVRNQHITLKK